MSAEQKQAFDTYFKIFLGVAIAFFGWLGARYIDKQDGFASDVQEMKNEVSVMRTDIQWIKMEMKKDTKDNGQ